MADVTMQEWEETTAKVRGDVRRAVEDAPEGSTLRAVLAELEEPTSDFVNAVVERVAA